jgi:hypothetical protein
MHARSHSIPLDWVLRGLEMLMLPIDMFVNRHKYFRFNGRTAGITFAYAVAFPAFLGYFAYTTDVSSLPEDYRGSV